MDNYLSKYRSVYFEDLINQGYVGVILDGPIVPNFKNVKTIWVKGDNMEYTTKYNPNLTISAYYVRGPGNIVEKTKEQLLIKGMPIINQLKVGNFISIIKGYKQSLSNPSIITDNYIIQPHYYSSAVNSAVTTIVNNNNNNCDHELISDINEWINQGFIKRIEPIIRNDLNSLREQQHTNDYWWPCTQCNKLLLCFHTTIDNESLLSNYLTEQNDEMYCVICGEWVKSVDKDVKYQEITKKAILSGTTMSTFTLDSGDSDLYLIKSRFTEYFQSPNLLFKTDISSDQLAKLLMDSCLRYTQKLFNVINKDISLKQYHAMKQKNNIINLIILVFVYHLMKLYPKRIWVPGKKPKNVKEWIKMQRFSEDVKKTIIESDSLTIVDNQMSKLIADHKINPAKLITKGSIDRFILTSLSMNPDVINTINERDDVRSLTDVVEIVDQSPKFKIELIPVEKSSELMTEPYIFSTHLFNDIKITKPLEMPVAKPPKYHNLSSLPAKMTMTKRENKILKPFVTDLNKNLKLIKSELKQLVDDDIINEPLSTLDDDVETEAPLGPADDTEDENSEEEDLKDDDIQKLVDSSIERLND